jgi:hypothetical protein
MSVYKISNSENSFVYVGKTLDSIYRRLSEHEKDYGGWLSRCCRKNYVSSFEILKFNGYKIELLETVDDMTLLSDREKYHINNMQCVNIIGNKNLSMPLFLCPCGEFVDATIRYKHVKSPAHRQSLRDSHSKSNTRQQFIKMYKDSKIKNIPEIPNGITLNID